MTDAAADFHTEAYHLHRQGQIADAVPLYCRALEADPGFQVAWSNLGLALLALRQADNALSCHRRALLLDPDSADAQNNLGMTLYAQGHLAEAENAFRAALRLDPSHANATLNLGTMQQLKDRPEAAEALFRQALALGVDPARGRANLALSLLEQVRPQDAEACCREALAADPSSPQARTNLSLALLMQGRLTEGWQEYEARWAVEALAGPTGVRVPVLPQPRWTGQQLNGEAVLLWAEQGFGDVLQFCRYAPMVARAGGRVVLVVPAALKRLMATLDGVAEVLSEHDGMLPPFDHHCPLLSLPHAFGTTLETIPAPAQYLSGDPRPWADVLAGMSGLKVGLVWAGRSRTEQPHAVAIDRRRSMRLADMLPLLSVPGCSFISLQLGPPAAQLRQAPGLPLLDVSERLADWADTAGLISGLDLVIAVDTAVAHLAGALGRPVWMLNRFDSCWRWFLDRDDTPWYPSMRLFRQTRRGDWTGVIQRAAAALAKEAQRPKA
ncbi:MAG TPA: tetratricopeptide repeat protein [Rhodopila sp.]|nr:tetratricopeptide repeat protein [Rhodopila sp.]